MIQNIRGYKKTSSFAARKKDAIQKTKLVKLPLSLGADNLRDFTLLFLSSACNSGFCRFY